MPKKTMCSPDGRGPGSEASLRHPFAVKRTRELMNWVGDGGYDLVRSGTYVHRGQEAPVTAEVQRAIVHYRERFLASWALLRAAWTGCCGNWRTGSGRDGTATTRTTTRPST